jgi:hypothetical protein
MTVHRDTNLERVAPGRRNSSELDESIHDNPCTKSDGGFNFEVQPKDIVVGRQKQNGERSDRVV